MTLNKKVIVTSILLLVSAVSLYFLVYHKTNYLSQEKENKNSGNTDDKEYKYLGNKEYQEKVNNWLRQKQETAASYSKGPGWPANFIDSKWAKILKIAQGRISTIRFSGLVLDQNGNPVEGVEVKYSGNSGFLAEGDGFNVMLTDSGGFFQIKDVKGTSLSIRDLKKKGYRFVSKKGLDFFGHKIDKNADLWKNYNMQNPYIFRMYRIDKYEKVKTNITSPYKRYGYKPDGTIYTMNFLASRFGIKTQGVHDGDLLVSFRRTDEQWTLHLEAINGGLQETEDTYLFEAPAKGYIESVDYQYRQGEPEPILKNLYFTSRGRQYYGVIMMKIYPYYRDKSVIKLSFVINLESGRKLAVRPAQ